MTEVELIEAMRLLARLRGMEDDEFEAEVGHAETPDFWIHNAAIVLDLPTDLLDDPSPVGEALAEFA